MNKEKLMKIIKSRITVGIFGVLVGAMLCTNSTEDQNKINKYNNVVEENEDLTATNKELQEKVSKSEKYLSLNDNEKDLVDTKIDEVKQATADEIARQKAEKEEAERKAQEEAERAKLAQLVKLHDNTVKLKSGLNIAVMVNTYPNDYLQFNEDQKKALATVINNVRSMGELINTRVN